MCNIHFTLYGLNISLSCPTQTFINIKWFLFSLNQTYITKVVQNWAAIYRQMEGKYDSMMKQLTKTEKRLTEMTEKEQNQRTISAQLRSELDTAEKEIEFHVTLS